MPSSLFGAKQVLLEIAIIQGSGGRLTLRGAPVTSSVTVCPHGASVVPSLEGDYGHHLPYTVVRKSK